MAGQQTGDGEQKDVRDTAQRRKEQAAKALQYQAGRCRRSVAARPGNLPSSGGPVAGALGPLDAPPRGGPSGAQPAGSATAPNSGPVTTASPTTYRPHKACVLLGLQQGRQRAAHGGALLLELPVPAHNNVASGTTHTTHGQGVKGKPTPPVASTAPHAPAETPPDACDTPQQNRTARRQATTQAQKQQKRDSTQNAREKECKRGARSGSPTAHPPGAQRTAGTR